MVSLQNQDTQAKLVQLTEDINKDILPTIQENKVRLNDHELRLKRIEDSTKDSHWRSDKLHNIKVSMTGKSSGT